MPRRTRHEANSSSTCQLVVLDIMLPGIDGFGVLSALRARRNTPVLMLTARDRVQGLQAGADDYLVKPFAFSELLARVAALLRRGPGANAEAALCKRLRGLCDVPYPVTSKLELGDLPHDPFNAHGESGEES